MKTLAALRRARRGTWAAAIFLACAGLVSVVASVGLVLAQGLGSIAPTPLPEAVPMAPPPALSVQAVPPYGQVPLMVGFLVTAVDPADIGFVAFNWNFGDGHLANEPPNLAYNTYNKPGTYVVTVTGMTAGGRSATAFTGVIVRPRTNG